MDAYQKISHEEALRIDTVDNACLTFEETSKDPLNQGN